MYNLTVFAANHYQYPLAVWQHRSRLLNEVKKKLWPGQVAKPPSDRMAYSKSMIIFHYHAVERPWDMVLQPSDYIHQPKIAVNVKVIDVFDEAGGELLILGEPGSGKTLILLNLAYDLAILAEQERDGTPTSSSIPVVFDLSSWTKKRKAIANWLVDQLDAEYQIPKNIGRMWVNNQQLLLLLDELDKVEQKYRPGCVKALNHFHQHYGLEKMVVCCRMTEYAALPVRLKLQDAIVLQPPNYKLTQFNTNGGFYVA